MSDTTISTFQLFQMFPDQEAARKYLEATMWPHGPVCPECGCLDRITARKDGFYRCNPCKHDFTIRTGTIFGRSHIPLHKWIYAMYLLMTARKGISSLQLSKEIGIAQSSARFMLSRNPRGLRERPFGAGRDLWPGARAACAWGGEDREMGEDGVSEPYLEWLAWLRAARIDLPWCAAVCKAGREAEVAGELAMAGWSTYLPMETVWANRTAAHRAKRRIRRPLFVRYLFVACNEGGDVSAPASVRGLVAVRRSASGRSMVRLDLLGRLMLTEANGGLDLTKEAKPSCATRFTPGQAVKIAGGVLNGFEARIVKVLNAREVRASYLLYGQEGVATFEKADLKAA